jgi:hydrogenase-4 component E
VPVGFTMMTTGMFLIVARRTAVNQVIGYLVLENGIYAFGLALVRDIPLLVELGVLMDMFVAVFVMGIAIYHINREFDHMDSEKLTSLKG